MENIHWEIIQVEGAEVGILGLRLVDTQKPDAVWPYYFTGIRANDYPAAIEAAVQETGSGGECTGVNFPADLDDYDLINREPLSFNTVEIYHHDFGDIIISRATFYEVLEEFAQCLVEQPGQPIAWYDAMQAALAKLRAKMATDAAG